MPVDPSKSNDVDHSTNNDQVKKKKKKSIGNEQLNDQNHFCQTDISASSSSQSLMDIAFGRTPTTSVTTTAITTTNVVENDQKPRRAPSRRKQHSEPTDTLVRRATTAPPEPTGPTNTLVRKAKKPTSLVPSLS